VCRVGILTEVFSDRVCINAMAYPLFRWRAFTDALNIIDPENSYSLVGYDDEFDDDEIYE
ncbi:hypothetical protein CDG79_38945, partial [Nostoc sp. 'Peltigera membranacea cyanobiont' 232]